MLPYALFKALHLTMQEVKGLLVLGIILDVVVLILLVGLLGHQLSDKVGKLALKGCRALAIELVVAEINEQIGKVISFFRDSQTQILGYCLCYLIRVDADRVLARQSQIVGETPRQLLHEGIDGAHAKTAIVVHNMRHQALRVAFQFRIANAQFLNQFRLH